MFSHIASSSQSKENCIVRVYNKFVTYAYTKLSIRLTFSWGLSPPVIVSYIFNVIKCIAYNRKYITALPILKCKISNIGMQCLLLLDCVCRRIRLYGLAGTFTVQYHVLEYNVCEISLLYLCGSCHG